MKTRNFLDKTFGPVGTSAGILLFVVGLFTSFTSLFGLILLVPGAFIGFTSSSCVIDWPKKRVKFTTNLFGIIRTGKWVNIEPDMKIGIKKSNRVWRAYSWSNRTLDLEKSDFRIILYDRNNKQIMPIKKAKTPEEASHEGISLSDRLGLKFN